MRAHTFFLATCISMMAALTVPSTVLGPECQAKESGTPSSLLSIGKIGPDGIALNAQIVKLPKKPSDRGEPLALKLKVAKEAYVTLLYLSSKGDVTILLPNVENPNNRLKPNKEYTFFGVGSSIRLTIGTKSTNAKIVCYVSSKPVKISLSKLPKGMTFLTIPKSSTNEMEARKTQIANVATTSGFNRQVMRMEGPEATSVDLKMMGIPKAIKSKKPGTVTGVQGYKEDIEKGEKK